MDISTKIIYLEFLKDNIESGYVFVEKWDNFVHNPFAAIKIAFYHKEEASPSTKI